MTLDRAEMSELTNFGALPQLTRPLGAACGLSSRAHAATRNARQVAALIGSDLWLLRRTRRSGRQSGRHRDPKCVRAFALVGLHGRVGWGCSPWDFTDAAPDAPTPTRLAPSPMRYLH